MNDFNYQQHDIVDFTDLRELSLENALVEIEKKPWLWLAEINLACLKTFIVGWLNSNLNYEDEVLIKGFTGFVLSNYDQEQSSMDWYATLMFKNENKTDKEKVEEFYSLFSEYQRKRKVEMLEG